MVITRFKITSHFRNSNNPQEISTSREGSYTLLCFRNKTKEYFYTICSLSGLTILSYASYGGIKNSLLN